MMERGRWDYERISDGGGEKRVAGESDGGRRVKRKSNRWKKGVRRERCIK